MSYDAPVFHAVRKVSVRARDAIQTGFIVQFGKCGIICFHHL